MHAILCRHTFPITFTIDLSSASVYARFRFHGVELHVGPKRPTIAMFEIFLQIQDFLPGFVDQQLAR